MIADQDCDLANHALAHSDYKVELRPVWCDSPPDDWGIRSARFLLDASGAHLQADAPSVHVTSDVLEIAEHRTCPCTDSARRLKTWLGLRYDRPAVPEAYGVIAGKLADRLKKRGRRVGGERLRDVLASFRTVNGQVEYKLVAVLPGRGTTQEVLDEVKEWLAEVALEVPEEFGHPIDIEARRDSEVTLAFIENSYGLAVSNLSWPANQPGPVGAI